MNERNKKQPGDDDIPGIAPAGTSPLLEAIKHYIKQEYEPTMDYVEAVKLSTNEFLRTDYPVVSFWSYYAGCG